MTPELHARIVADSRDLVAWLRARSRGITATDVASLSSDKSIIRAAEVEHGVSPAGHVPLGAAPHLRSLIVLTSERIVSILEHVGTGSLVFTASAEDYDVAELRPLLDRYGRGQGVDAAYRHRLCRLAWELTADSFGGRQQLYERLHSGSPEVTVAASYLRYDKSKAIDMVHRLIGAPD